MSKIRTSNSRYAACTPGAAPFFARTPGRAMRELRRHAARCGWELGSPDEPAWVEALAEGSPMVNGYGTNMGLSPKQCRRYAAHNPGGLTH